MRARPLCIEAAHINRTRAGDACVNQTQVGYRHELPFVRYFAFNRVASRTTLANATT